MPSTTPHLPGGPHPFTPGTPNRSQPPGAVHLVRTLPAHDPWRTVDPHTFGTWRDGIDLVPVDRARIRADIGLAAIAKDLEEDAVQTLARAAGSEEIAKFIRTLPDLVGSASRAIAWASWRRRNYLGIGDNFPVICVLSWLRRTEVGVVRSDAVFDELAWNATRASAEIENEAYPIALGPSSAELCGEKIDPGTVREHRCLLPREHLGYHVCADCGDSWTREVRT